MCRIRKARVTSRVRVDIIPRLAGKPVVEGNGNYCVVSARIRVPEPAMQMPRPRLRTQLPQSNCNGRDHSVVLPRRGRKRLSLDSNERRKYRLNKSRNCGQKPLFRHVRRVMRHAKMAMLSAQPD